MDSNTQSTATSGSTSLIERTQEIQALASLLPLNIFNQSSNRVYNIWSEKGVGKTTLIEALRDSEELNHKKIVWITPSSNPPVDTPQEFIAACGKGIRYPKDLKREKKLSKKLEDSQKGKIDLVRSDDSILITRSSIATNKKPYVNAAAASSVGRTSYVREDMEVSVGLGGNRAGNQAEAFLDALPLQSMGTDLIILHILNEDGLSGAVRDWFRDYVIPAATKGAYRRNLVVLVEAKEPFALHASDSSWGDWDDRVIDFRLYPTSNDNVSKYARGRGCSFSESHFVFIKSLGYPQAAVDAVDAIANGNRNAATTSTANSILATLSSSDKARLATCCLPVELNPDELDAIFGPGKGGRAMQWLTSLPDIPLRSSGNGDSKTIFDDFRLTAISAAESSNAFRESEKRWLPYARLVRNAPAKSARAKLFLLAGLNWIDDELCQSLFGEKSKKVLDFIEKDEVFFAKRKKYARISERIREDLRATASNMEHIGISSISEQAKFLWDRNRNSLSQKIDDLQQSLKTADERLQALQSRHSQVNSLIKQHRGSGIPTYDASTLVTANSNSHGKLIFLLSALAITFFAAGFWFEAPLNIVGTISGIVSFIICLFLLPKWKRQRVARATAKRATVKNSPEYLRKENLDLIQQINACETAHDDLQREVSLAKEELKYSYV